MNVTEKEIAFDRLRRADTICMQTTRSNYQFSVIDPSIRKGLLSGGSLGDDTIEAFWTGMVSEDNGDFDEDKLKTGARAVFFVESRACIRRFITSTVTDLDVARTAESH